jgi:hypothetical protein
MDNEEQSNTGTFTVPEKNIEQPPIDSGIVEKGKLGYYESMIGKGEDAKINIGFAVLRYILLGSGIIILLIVIIDSALLLLIGQVLVSFDSLEKFLGIISPIVTLILGYIFGNRDK